LEPSKNYTFLILEAYYKTPTLVPYNGNLLVDNFSDIKVSVCKESSVQDNLAQAEKKPEMVVVKAETIRVDIKDSNAVKPKESSQSPPVTTVPKDIIENASISNLKRTDLKNG
jgi:hypothetical protein